MMIRLIFSNGPQCEKELTSARNWREASHIARQQLARYGSVHTERPPNGTDRLWVSEGAAVHGIAEDNPHW